MVDSLNEGGAIAARVPTVDRYHWQWLRESEKPREFGFSDPWCVNSVHITHFSTDGLTTMASQLGMPYLTCISQGIVVFAKQPIPQPKEPEELPVRKPLFAAAGFAW
jgi:hypothetical protein